MYILYRKSIDSSIDFPVTSVEKALRVEVKFSYVIDKDVKE